MTNLTRHSISPDRWIIAITGASGTIYARRLVTSLMTAVPAVQFELMISEAGFRVLREEEDLRLSQSSPDLALLFDDRASSRIQFHHHHDVGACVASGSYPVRGMVVVPCSMSTVGAIASGYNANLVHRAAEVTLKERRPLILVPRESPLSELHLENLLKLSRLGVQIVPAMPGFYQQPKTIDEMVDAFVMRVADQMGYYLDLCPRWKEERQQ